MLSYTKIESALSERTRSRLSELFGHIACQTLLEYWERLEGTVIASEPWPLSRKSTPELRLKRILKILIWEASASLNPEKTSEDILELSDLRDFISFHQGLDQPNSFSDAHNTIKILPSVYWERILSAKLPLLIKQAILLDSTRHFHLVETDFKKEAKSRIRDLEAKVVRGEQIKSNQSTICPDSIFFKKLKRSLERLS